MKIVWGVTYSDYEEYSVLSIHEDAKDAYHAAGYFDNEGKPKIGNNATYNDVEAFALFEKDEKVEDMSIRLEDERWKEYLNIFYLPALIRKYEEGRRLDRIEKVRVGLIEPSRQDLT